MKATTKIDWEAWQMPGWRPRLTFADLLYGWRTCGSATLSLITGLSPVEIERRLPRSQRHWSTGAAAAFLRKNGWKTALLNPRSISDSLSSFHWDDQTLNNNHLLLMNCMTSRFEASWFLFENGKVWHNFSVESTGPLFLLRRPLQDAVLLRK